MNSREKILASVKKNQPAIQPLHELNFLSSPPGNLKEKFIKTLTGIGGTVLQVNDWKEIAAHIKQEFPISSRIINTVQELNSDFGILTSESNPQNFKDVNLAILQGEFGVAENGAIWLTNASMGDQVLPYITEHLILIIRQDAIVPTLHEAYEKIGNANYTLGTFLAGPSKTADIEQSLVLGAHGSKSLLVYLLR
jgi:L-lactate dehydrogenase complex protein LldG